MNDTSNQPEVSPNPEKSTIAVLFDQHAPRLYNFAVRLSHEPKVADQIVGEAFAQLLGELSTGKGPSPDPRISLYRTRIPSPPATLRAQLPFVQPLRNRSQAYLLSPGRQVSTETRGSSNRQYILDGVLLTVNHS